MTSRVEGGPQAVLEASYRKVKILSTNVGMAPDILHEDCICNSKDEFAEKVRNGVDRREENYASVMDYTPDKIIPKWDDFFESQVRKRK